MSYRKWYWLSAAVAAVGVVLYLMGKYQTPNSTALIVIGLLLFIAGIITAFAKLRCPHCHKLLPDIRGLKYCPRCGKEVDLKN